MEATTVLALLSVLLVGVLLGLLAGVAWARSRGDGAARHALESRAAEQALLKHSLDTLQGQMRQLQDQRVSWQAQLQQQVADMRHSTDLLRRETGSLATA